MIIHSVHMYIYNNPRALAALLTTGTYHQLVPSQAS